MGLTYDDYIRTTSDRHKHGVQALWRRIRDNGYIYKGHYTGQYCVFDELYVESSGRARLVRNVDVPRKRFEKRITSSNCPHFRTSSLSFTPDSRISSGRKRAGMKCCHSCAPGFATSQ